MPDAWTDLIVGDRMAVDQQFADRVANSQFSRQQWGLVMTAVQFDIEQPTDDDAARLVADTSDLPAVMPELDSVDQQHPMGAGGPSRGRDRGAGLLDGIRNALGMGGDGGGDAESPGHEQPAGDVDQDRLSAAEQLTQAYADTLQTRLEDEGRWGEVRAAYETQ